MYCKKHKNMVRCNSIGFSKCELCGEDVITFNSPPLDKVCENCSKNNKICKFCKKDLDENSY